LAGGPPGKEDLFLTHVTGTDNLLKAVQSVPDYSPRVVVAGSAAEYGDLGATPIPEQAREVPTSKYGVAKLAQTRLVMLERRGGLDATVARLFNVMGPGMSADLAPARFARELLRAKREGSPRLAVGDLTAIRDYLDIEDVVRGLWMIGQAPITHEIVNLCSGTPVRMCEVFAELARQIGIQVEPEQDPALLRGPAHVPASIGDARLFDSLTGTHLSFDMTRSVERLLSGPPRPAM
jgi:GDP-4-dehydro-6-deoxy-D-mannose reductase